MSRVVLRSWVAWLAAFSLLLNGLLPLVAHAAPAASAQAMAICSAGGATAPEQPHGTVLHCLAHCGIAQPLALPADPAPAGVAELLPAQRAALAESAARATDQPYRRARPRGPPRA